MHFTLYSRSYCHLCQDMLDALLLLQPPDKPFTVDVIDIDALRTDIMARLERHRDRHDRFERIIAKRFPAGTAAPADLGKLLNLRLGVRHERTVVEWCEEALEALSQGRAPSNVTPMGEATRENKG